MEKKQRIAVRPIAGGLKDSRNPLLLADGETPFAENVEFDRDSIKEVGGSIKFNNRPAPPAAVRTVAPLEPQPLTNVVESTNISTPMRGYVVIPYSKEQDIGGQTFHDNTVSSYSDYRGRSFNLKVSFKIPEGTKLYGPSGTTGQDHYGNLNEALGECFIIAQKGGDRFQPMSWALGVVNVGDDEVFDMITGGSNFGEARSTYRLVFMWLDAPKFAFTDPGGSEDFKYSLIDDLGPLNKFGTLALRSFVIDHDIDVGTNYHVSLSLTIDTGSLTTSSTSWNDDGLIDATVTNDFENAPSTYTYVASTDTATGLYVWTGPQDSLDYFSRYGVRYASRDEMYLGLGFRTIPYVPGGSVPWGMDATALEHGGFSMNTNKGVKTYMDANSTAVLGTITHASGNNYIEISRQHVTKGSVATTLDVLKNPFGIASNSGGSIQYAAWQGQGDGTTTYNTEALRGYHIVESSSTTKRIMTIEQYEENVTFEFECFDLESSTDVISAVNYWIYPFRWHQRDLIIADFRVYAKEGAYTTDRAKWGLHVAADLNDDNEVGIDQMVGYWPLDDGGGGVCKDLVGSNDAFFAPFQMGVSKRGLRGENQIFLSGEGEAIVLDLSKNPIFEREMLTNLRHDNMGIAVQVTMKLTGAEYSLQQIHPDPEVAGTAQLIAAWGPDLITWSVKDAAGSGMTATPLPIMKFGFNGRSAVGNQLRYRYPLGFNLEVADHDDQADFAMKSALDAWNPSDPEYDVFNVPWAGRTVTFQVGLHPGATAGKWIAYIAGAPAGLLAHEDELEGNDPNGEYVIFTSEFTIDDKDLARSVITIGGGWEPGSFGYQQTSARMVIDEVRVFAASAPGSLPTTTRDIVNDRSGKILGSHSLPLTELSEDDLLQDLGLGVTQVDVTDGSTTVKAVSVLEFYGGNPEDTDESIEGAYLRIAQDQHIKLEKEKLGVVQEEFYRIKTLTGSASSGSGKSEMELHTPYEGHTLTNIQAKSFRVVGYTAFSDDFSEVALPTSTGSGFDPSSATVGDAVISPDLWHNRAPVTGNWAVRLYSPLSGMSIHDIAPQWTGGFLEPRRNPIRGMHSLNDKLYAQAGASLFEVDDRWRTTRDGIDALTWLAFRSRDVGVDRLHSPLVGDRLTFTNMDEVGLHRANTDPGGGAHYTRMIDFEVELEEVRGLQTVYQLLNESTYAGLAADTDAWEMNHWVRFRDGQPQLVVGLDKTYDGANNPPRNLWVATGDSTLRPGERTHVRWIIEDQNSEDNLYLKPICMVNGKKVDVLLNATEDGTSGTEWISSGTAVPTSNAATLLVGCAVDFYEENTTDTTYVDGEIRGEYLRPKFHSGYMHSLNGKLRNLVIGEDDSFNAASNTDDTDYNFNWRDITYPTWGSSRELVNLACNEGVGHKCKEEATDVYGLIYSGPFIDMYSGMESRDQHATFAAVGDQVYCTNGGRPVVLDQDFGARQAGLIPPRSAPDFEIEQLPLWKPNTTTDPVETSHNHYYSTRGNSYLSVPHHIDMNWESGDTWAFKGFVRPHSIHGRIPLVSSRLSLTSGGPAVEIIDGKCRFSYYDTVLKAEQWIETSTQVWYPGFWHYVYVRKNFPTTGGWDNQVVFENSSTTEDMMVVRVLQDSGIDPNEEEWLPNMFTADASPAVTAQLCVSYTEGNTLTSGTATASGLCTPAGGNYVGAASGVVTRNPVSNTFTDDMIGRFWQWDTATDLSPVDERKVYVITAVTSASVLVVSEIGGAAPDFSSISGATGGGVFLGAELVKSTDFDTSVNPDTFEYTTEFFGSSMGDFPLSGVTPFNGDFASFGATVTATTKVFDNADATDHARTGTDGFSFHPDEGTEMGPLTYDGTNGDTFWVVQDSDPNDDLELAMDTEASDNADALVWQKSTSIQMLQGFRRVRITFFDTEQNVESNPGPELLIEPSLEDQVSTSGAARILVKDIPLSPQPGKVIRRVYMSLADGGVLFRVAELEDNVSDSMVVYKSEFAIGQGSPLEYNRNAPPKCDVVHAGAGVMWYGGLDLQPNGVLFSNPFEPSAIPFTNLLLFDTGDNSPITGLHEHAGRMLVFKRDAIYAATVVPGGVVQETVSRGAGSVNQNCIQQLDDRLYFIESRGVQHMAPFGEPQRISEEIEVFFNTDWDLTQQKFVVGGLNRAREQYLFCTKETASDYPDVRYAAELMQGSSVLEKDARSMKHRYSRFKGPNLTALATLWDRFGDNYKLVAGTEEGFVIWMDRSDSQLHMMGEDTNIYGRSSLTLAASSDLQLFEISAGSMDTTLSSVRGTKVRFQDSSDVEYEGTILAMVGTTVILDRNRTVAVVTGDNIILGATRPLYRSKWFDLGMPELTKKSVIIDISRTDQSTGTLTLTTYQDFSDTARDTITMSQTSPLGHYPTSAHGAVLQFRISEPYASAGTVFELVDLVWRVQFTDSW